MGLISSVNGALVNVTFFFLTRGFGDFVPKQWCFRVSGAQNGRVGSLSALLGGSSGVGILDSLRPCSCMDTGVPRVVVQFVIPVGEELVIFQLHVNSESLVSD